MAASRLDAPAAAGHPPTAVAGVSAVRPADTAGAVRRLARTVGTPLVRWLQDEALPLWSTAGIDPDGGFHEKIDARGRPVDAPRRTRVVARQVYVFATAARHGWLAGADACVDHGLRFLLERCRRPDGLYASAVRVDGAVVDPAFDLYEQAFALFALAAARRGRPDRAGLRDEAEALLGRLRRGHGHPAAGFEESAPRSLPLKANPHMHLLEAALEWTEASDGAQRPIWDDLADELVDLCLTRLIEPTTGALSEYFDGDWRPVRGAQAGVVEPGHQFEWGWLLLRWAQRRGGAPQAVDAARRLIRLGEAHGIDATLGVAVNQLGADLACVDGGARLWPQTERVKAWLAMAQHAADTGDAAGAAEASAALARAAHGLWRLIRAAPPGRWQELMQPDGSFVPTDSRASSLYHVVCAIETLHTGAGDAAVAPARQAG